MTEKNLVLSTSHTGVVVNSMMTGKADKMAAYYWAFSNAGVRELLPVAVIYNTQYTTLACERKNANNPLIL